jgi:glycosyltransferase involved in cell wall biosynthesis
MTKPILPKVCLCAIVRDEEINPAGGIEDFVNCTVPFVENAVIVDTGSTDRTIDILEQAKVKHPNLKVIETKFQGYAEARNFSLQNVKGLGEYALVLDADERLFAQDFETLNKTFQEKPGLIGINFKLLDIYPTEGIQRNFCGIHNPRLFYQNSRFNYRNQIGSSGEILLQGFSDAYLVPGIIDSEITIKHFKPEKKSQRKKEQWYLQFGDPSRQIQSQDPHFHDWKQLNPRRANYQ